MGSLQGSVEELWHCQAWFEQKTRGVASFGEEGSRRPLGRDKD